MGLKCADLVCKGYSLSVAGNLCFQGSESVALTLLAPSFIVVSPPQSVAAIRSFLIIIECGSRPAQFTRQGYSIAT
jgi:hypothetical protein